MEWSDTQRPLVVEGADEAADKAVHAEHECIFRTRYWEIRKVLDLALLGEEHTDGAGYGIVEDAELVVKQRDWARAAIRRMIEAAVREGPRSIGEDLP